MPNKFSKLINKEIFPYLWNSNYNPIRRDVLFQSKLNGGLDVKNVFFKAQSIMSSTFLKQFMRPNDNELLKYYCAIRVNPLLDIRVLPHKVSFVNPEYFAEPITIIRKLKNVNTFPNVNSNDIYECLLPKCQPLIQSKIYINWKSTWNNLSFKYINLSEREILYKHLHGILTTKLRLF